MKCASTDLRLIPTSSAKKEKNWACISKSRGSVVKGWGNELMRFHVILLQDACWAHTNRDRGTSRCRHDRSGLGMPREDDIRRLRNPETSKGEMSVKDEGAELKLRVRLCGRWTGVGSFP